MFAVPVLATILIGATACNSQSGSSRDDYYFTDVIFPNGTTIKAEAIRDPISMQRGMMFRDSLAADRGMLFSHGQASTFPYWMHNVKMPLDIIWLDPQRRIVEIVASAPPCPRKPCPVHGGSKPAMYVLEVNGGIAAKNKLAVGDTLRFVGY